MKCGSSQGCSVGVLFLRVGSGLGWSTGSPGIQVLGVMSLCAVALQLCCVSGLTIGPCAAWLWTAADTRRCPCGCQPFADFPCLSSDATSAWTPCRILTHVEVGIFRLALVTNLPKAPLFPLEFWILSFPYSLPGWGTGSVCAPVCFMLLSWIYFLTREQCCDCQLAIPIFCAIWDHVGPDSDRIPIPDAVRGKQTGGHKRLALRSHHA